jgi:hypothetical protein
MATWRRKVIELFPDLRREFEEPDCTIYTVFFELLPRVRTAHENGDIETLRRIYGFAEWCFQQKAKDLWNAAGVAFYEHLFDSGQPLWGEIVRWLSPNVIEGVWGLWEFRLPKQQLAEVKHLIDARQEPLYGELRAIIAPPGADEF